MSIAHIVKDNMAKFSFYRDGMLYYHVIDHGTNTPRWLFPVNIKDKNDIGNSTFPCDIKAITLMRYIRKALEAETLVELKGK